MATLLFLAHLGATCCMTGLIWFVQVVHYPLFANTGAAGYADYQRRHMALTTRVVAPVMVVEAGTAVLLFWTRPVGIPAWQVATGVVLLAVIWLSTALVQVPCHGRLSSGFDADAHRRLVSTNWIRTVAWTLRTLLVLWMACRVLNPSQPR